MARYRYQAAQPDGALIGGVLQVADHAGAVDSLLARGLSPVSVEIDEAGREGGRAAGRADLAVLFRSLASLVGAGVPIERALGASVPLTSRRLQDAVEAMRRSLHEGASLSAALAETQGLVPPLVVGMIRAGERASRLPDALEQVATHLDQEVELLGRVRQALAYPLVLGSVGLVSVGVISLVILPRFAELLGDLGQDLPITTRYLLAAAGIIRSYGLLILLGGVAAAAALAAWSRQPEARRWIHGTLLRVPLVGPLRHALATARFGRSLAAMLSAGMPMLTALDAAADAVGDRAIRDRVLRTRERVARGEPLTGALSHEVAVTPTALQLLAVGEASGQLGLMARRAGDLAAREAERALKTLASLLEPGLVIAFGGMVAFVAAALLQAVYSLRPGG